MWRAFGCVGLLAAAAWLLQLPPAQLETREYLSVLPVASRAAAQHQGGGSSVAATRPLLTPPPPPPPAVELPASVDAARVVSCPPLPQWPAARFVADQDWVPLADGRETNGETLWQFTQGKRAGAGAGHLRNQKTNAHLNLRPGDFVRGHGNHGSSHPAEMGSSTLIKLVPIASFDPATGARCASTSVALRFVGMKSQQRFVHVDEQGALAASMTECADERRCLFDVESEQTNTTKRSTKSPTKKASEKLVLSGLSQDNLQNALLLNLLHGGSIRLRSRLTGLLVRMVDNSHVPFTGWDGVRIRAKPKRDQKERVEVREFGCPLRRRAAATARAARWRYDGARHAAQIRAALAPWEGGGVTATAIDVTFWHEMFPPENSREKPSLHVSVRERGRALSYTWQMERQLPGGAPPDNSSDAATLRMLAGVAAGVKLPEVEFVAHSEGRPKVFAQNPEPVIAPATDPAHNDIAAPSWWAWEALAPETFGSASCGARERRRPALYLEVDCSQLPREGYHGPLWRLYAAQRAVLVAANIPKLFTVYDGCAAAGDALAVENQVVPLEGAWTRLAQAERREAAGAARRRRASEPREQPRACDFRWVLLLAEAGPPRQLAMRMRQNWTIFLQESPYREHFYDQLVPWVHFVPVAANLANLQQRIRWAASHEAEAEAIAARAQQLAQELGVLELSCYWWQLLEAFAPLQDFEPRQLDRRLQLPAFEARRQRNRGDA